MTGATIILIIFGIFAAAVGGTVVVFFGRIVWAMRNPEKFKALEEREAAAESARRRKLDEAERERIRLGKPSWSGRLFGAVFTLVGVFIVALSVWQTNEIVRARSWERAECIVTGSGINSSTSSRSATTFRPKVAYTYDFRGRSYAGDRLDLPGTSYLSWDDARRAIRNYSPGAVVECFVNPAAPAESVLDRSPWLFPFYQNGLGMILCFGLGGLLLYVSRRRKPQEVVNRES